MHPGIVDTFKVHRDETGDFLVVTMQGENLSLGEGKESAHNKFVLHAMDMVLSTAIGDTSYKPHIAAAVAQEDGSIRSNKDAMVVAVKESSLPENVSKALLELGSEKAAQTTAQINMALQNPMRFRATATKLRTADTVHARG